jgi:alpha-tubulin suppressor-like RCC1 family protein
MFDSLAMNADGIVFGWGANSYGELGIGNKQDQVLPIQAK